jgi:mono/diheme cytochrome c family protein
MRQGTLGLGGSIAVLCLLAMASGGPAVAQGVKPKPHDTEWVAPTAERAKTSPVLASSAGLERGHQLYIKHCATCHGDQVKGDGKVIMPAYKTQVAADEDRWHIVQFVRTLGPTR